MNEELLLQSQILSNISEGINLVKAKSGLILFTNPKFDKMFGYESRELIGKHISILNNPTEDKNSEQKSQEIMNSMLINNEWKGEICNIKKDGTILWCFASVSWFNHSKYGKVLISLHRDITAQKLAEKELTLTKERLKTFMSSATDGFILFDSDLNHIDINDKALEITGLSKSKIVGKNLIDIVPNIKESRRYNEYKKVINTGKEYFKTFKPHPKFGNKLIELKAFKINSGLGMILKDITEQNQTKKELLESEEKLRYIFENSTNLFFSHTADHIITYLSPQVNNILGYSQEEAMINWTNFASNNPINEIGFNNTIKAIETGKQQPPYELELIHKSGRKVMVEVREAPIVKNGKTVSIVGALADITERKKAENKLLKNQYYLKKAQEIGNIGAWELDIQNTVLTWTNENYKIFDVPLGTEMNYELFLSYIHPKDMNYVREKWSAALNKEPFDIEHRIIVNNKTKWLREKAYIEFDTKANPITAIGFTQDITERKVAEENLNQSLSLLRSTLESTADGILVVNTKGEWTSFNQKFIKMWNFPNNLIDSCNDKNAIEYILPQLKYPDDFVKRVKHLYDNPKEISIDLIETNDGKIIKRYSQPQFENEKIVGRVWNFHDITKQKKAELELYKSNKKLHELTMHMQDAIENERKKIALDLHDDLGQSLTILNMDLSWLEKKTLKELPHLSNKLKEMKELLNSTMQNAQEIASKLRPSLLDNLGLIPAIEWLLKEYKLKSKLKYQFNTSPNKLIIKKRFSVTIFRIIQEALTNVVRHANATLVIVSISKKNKLIKIIIEDNGKGITKKDIEDSKSFGLMGIKERANVFKGEVIISGESNKGTKLEIILPYE